MILLLPSGGKVCCIEWAFKWNQYGCSKSTSCQMLFVKEQHLASTRLFHVHSFFAVFLFYSSAWNFAGRFLKSVIGSFPPILVCRNIPEFEFQIIKKSNCIIRRVAVRFELDTQVITHTPTITLSSNGGNCTEPETCFTSRCFSACLLVNGVAHPLTVIACACETFVLEQLRVPEGAAARWVSRGRATASRDPPVAAPASECSTPLWDSPVLCSL